MNRSAPKILIVKLSAIGDVVHTLPALNALRRQYPKAHITWVVEEAAADLVIGHPALDRVLVSKRKKWSKGLKTGHYRHHFQQIMAFIGQLRDTRYDMILDFQAALKGAMLVGLARGNRKIGFGPGMEHQECSYLVLNERIAGVSMEIHALERGLMMLEAIGVPRGDVSYDLPMSRAAQEKAKRLLEPPGKGQIRSRAIAINPVAKWDTKLWPGDRFSQLANRLVERYEATIFFTGSHEDRPLIDQMIQQMRHPATNLAGCTSLPELAALYRQVACVVSTDTGPMHIAAAVDAPVIALFGPTAPWRTGPYGEMHRIIQTDISCQPCFRRQCETINCMDGISVDQVLFGVEKILSDVV